tara:strand:+ start:321 stop:533 length:213 start_codon:yes stop_codon:yes gene_type:complete
MKDKFEQIVGKVESGHLEPKEAVDELLVLFDVSQQRELLKGCTELNDDIKFERKSSARVFNNEKGIWEFI